MKVQSPGTESQPSKNVPFSQTEETCRGGVCFTPSPRGLACRLPGQPRAARLEFQPAASGLAPSAPTHPLPFLAGKGRASLGVTPASREGRGACLQAHPHPHPPRHHIFTFGCFFLSLLPLPRESSPGSRCRPSSHPKLSPIH